MAIDYIDPNGDITTQWGNGTGTGFGEINEGTRQPTAPTTTSYIEADGLNDANGDIAEYNFTSIASIVEATVVVVWVYLASGPFGSCSCKIKIGGSYSATQTFATGTSAWRSLTFDESSDPSLFPMSQTDLDGLSIAFIHNAGGPGTRETIYTAYAAITYTSGATGSSSSSTSNSSSSSSSSSESTAYQSSSSSSPSSSSSESTAFQSSSSSVSSESSSSSSSPSSLSSSSSSSSSSSFSSPSSASTSSSSSPSSQSSSSSSSEMERRDRRRNRFINGRFFWKP